MQNQVYQKLIECDQFKPSFIRPDMNDSSIIHIDQFSAHIEIHEDKLMAYVYIADANALKVYFPEKDWSEILMHMNNEIPYNLRSKKYIEKKDFGWNGEELYLTEEMSLNSTGLEIFITILDLHVLNIHILDFHVIQTF